MMADLPHQDKPQDPGRESSEIVTVRVGQTPLGPLPQIGLGMASHRQPLSSRERELLRALRPHHLRLDLQMAEAGWAAHLRQAVNEARGLEAELEIALHLSAGAEEDLEALARLAGRLRPSVCAFLIFHNHELVTSAQWIYLARRSLASAAPAAVFVGGTDVYFAQLNRNRPSLTGVDEISFSINPQVHTFDNRSLIETLEIQAQVVQSARRFCDGLAVSVSPVTLRPRFQPNRTGPVSIPPPGELPPQVDVRQISLFGAVWTVGSLKYLAESGAHRITYYETSGWRGVLEQVKGSPLPGRFPSKPGSVFPLYHILADVNEFAGGQVLPAVTNRPEQIVALALQRQDRRVVWLANLEDSSQEVKLKNMGPTLQVRSLDETNAGSAMECPEEFRQQAGHSQVTLAGELRLTLLPYAIIRVDDPRTGDWGTDTTKSSK